MEAEFPVGLMCELLGVSRAGYYRFKQGKVGEKADQKQRQMEQVKAVFWEHKRRYGTRRIAAELQGQGQAMGRLRVRGLMQAQDLQALQPKSFVPKTTDSKHGKRSSPNLLLDEAGNRNFKVLQPNQVWVGDITYLPLTAGGFVYLATWIDLYSRKVVGWQVAPNMEESLIISALTKALECRKPAPGLVIHSDRGGQYVSKRFRALLHQWKCKQSMSRAEDCYDNAIAESFFSRFKTELLQQGAFLELEDAKTECFEFMEGYYNSKRRHSAIGYKTPNQWEAIYLQNFT